MLLMFCWFLLSLIFKWWFQFSIRSLLLLMVVVAIPCSWLAAARQQAEKQREAVQRIWKAGGVAAYDYQVNPSGYLTLAAPPGPAWLRRLLGDNLFALSLDAVQVDFGISRAGDAELEHLNELPQLRCLILCCTNVGDAGLQNVERLARLQRLCLGGTRVSDAGLQHLGGLTQLQELDLGSTGVSDASLQHLKGLTQLKSLNLSNTRVTDAGVKRLQQALPNCKIQH